MILLVIVLAAIGAATVVTLAGHAVLVVYGWWLLARPRCERTGRGHCIDPDGSCTWCGALVTGGDQ